MVFSLCVFFLEMNESMAQNSKFAIEDLVHDMVNF